MLFTVLLCKEKVTESVSDRKLKLTKSIILQRRLQSSNGGTSSVFILKLRRHLREKKGRTIILCWTQERATTTEQVGFG